MRQRLNSRDSPLKWRLIWWPCCPRLPAAAKRQAVRQHWCSGRAGKQQLPQWAPPQGQQEVWMQQVPSSFSAGVSKSTLSYTKSSGGTDQVSLLGSQVAQVATLCTSLLIPSFATQKACVGCSQSPSLQCNPFFVLHITFITAQSERLGGPLRAPKLISFTGSTSM